MKVNYSNRFLKQLAQIPSGIRIKIEKFAFEDLPGATTLAEIGGIEKMKGYSGFYKIRFGSYRVGIKLAKEELTLQVVMDRKDIYKFFP